MYEFSAKTRGSMVKKTLPHQFHWIAGIKTLNLIPGWIFLDQQNRRYDNLKFHGCKSNKIEIKIIITIILIFFHQTRNSKETSNSHNMAAISPVLVGQKYPSGDQIQGLDVNYLMYEFDNVSDHTNPSFWREVQKFENSFLFFFLILRVNTHQNYCWDLKLG